jgi:hypothetical protein
MSEEDEEAKAFRPTGRAKPVMVAVAANVVLSVVLVGWPYLRGRTRARESVTALRQFSSCLLGGAPVDEAETDIVGLAIPRGERERFASLYLHSELSWPASCGASLDAMEHEPAIFLMPAVKTGEAEIHEAANAMRASLSALTDARLHTHGGVPERPLQDFSVLRAAVTSMLIANGLEADPEHAMIRFGEALDVAEPSRVPTRTAAGWWHLASNDEVRIVAADSRAVAELFVREGNAETPANVRLVQLRRPQSARGVVVADDATWLTWTTSESTCDADERHCALRSTGLGRLREDATTLETEWWLSGHPFERAERAVFIDATHAVILARTAEEGAALRVFDRAAVTAPATPVEGEVAVVEATEAERPHAPTQVIALPAMRDFALTDEALYAVESREGEAFLTRTPYDASARSETALPLATAQWLLTCGAHQLVGDGRVTLLASAGTVQRFETATDAPFHAASRDEDTVRVVCDATQVAWASLADGQLVMHRCAASACETIAWPIAGVTSFDLALHEGALWALASHEGSREVLVMQVGEGAPRAPAACWDSGHGFCGPARFGAGVGRLVIGARDESEVVLLVLGERGFEGIPGLVGG